jgi:hypothetical protein
MNLKYDHVFILVGKGAKEMDLFKKHGFGQPMIGRHDGQGTGCKILFFLNTLIELLYIDNDDEAINNIESFGCDYVERTKWKDNGQNPFGIGIVPKPNNIAQIPFKTKHYSPKWMRKEALQMALSNTNPEEPIVFCEPPIFEWSDFKNFDELENSDKDDIKKYFYHENGIARITKFKMYIKTDSLSKIIQELSKHNMDFECSEENLIELTFDENVQSKRLDFRPDLPLIINY